MKYKPGTARVSRVRGSSAEVADTASGDLGFHVALGACGGDAPGVHGLLKLVDGGVAEGLQRGGGMHGEPALGPALRQDGTDGCEGGSGVAAGGGGAHAAEDLAAGCEVERDLAARLPV